MKMNPLAGICICSMRAAELVVHGARVVTTELK
ncbi:hypothetical protein ACVWXM_001355 [Bradyrhizobium sp. GM7.3]|jgi:hypothetical protein